MECLVLAGGMGTRLRPLTFTVPKPLLPILNRPLVYHLLDRLPPEVDAVVIAVSYKSKQIEEAFRKDPPRQRVLVVNETEPLGTGGAVKNCERSFAGNPFLVVNGDLIAGLDLAALIAFHREKKALVTLSLTEVEDPSPFGVATLDGSGRVTGFVEKPPRDQAPSRLVNAGMFVADRELLANIPAGKVVSMEREVFPKLLSHPRGVWGFVFSDYWLDAGSPDTYLEANRILLGRKGVKNLVPEPAGVSPGAFLEETVVAPGVRVGDDCILYRCVIHEGAQIGELTHLRYTIVGKGAKIGERAFLDHCVVGADKMVSRGKKLENVKIPSS